MQLDTKSLTVLLISDIVFINTKVELVPGLYYYPVYVTSFANVQAQNIAIMRHTPHLISALP